MASRSGDRLGGDLIDVFWPLLPFVALAVVAVALSPGAWLRVPLTLAAVLLFPGYVLSLVVFPLATGDPGDGPGPYLGGGDWTLPSLGWIERWAVAVGFSIALMPLYGLTIAVTGLSYEGLPLVLVIALFTAVLAFLALVRRRRLPDHGRSSTPNTPTIGPLFGAVRTPHRGETLSNVFVVLTLGAAVAVLIAGIAVPAPSPDYTTAALLTEDGEELVAADYPHDLQPGESGQAVLLITNHEGETIEYTVVVQAQRVDRTGGVVERKRMDRFVAELSHNGTWKHPHEVRPGLSGDRVRLAYLIYRGAPPAEPTMDNAYRSLTLWVREPLPDSGDAQLSPQTIRVSAPTN